VERFAVPSYVSTAGAGATVGAIGGCIVGAVDVLGPTLGGVAPFGGVIRVVVAGVGAAVGCMDGPFTGPTLGTAPVGSRCTSVSTRRRQANLVEHQPALLEHQLGHAAPPG
jgi:hypothetical protein